MIAAPARTRVCLLAEELGGVSDEGGRNVAQQLARALAGICDLRAISIGGESGAGMGFVPSSKTFVSPRLRHELRALRPNLVVYLPSASMTLFAVLRAAMLRRYAPAARIALVVQQRRDLGAVARAIIRRAAPDIVFSQAARLCSDAEAMGCRTELLPPAVDLERFRPAGGLERVSLRQAYGIDEHAFVVLHAGHLKPERNLGVLVRLMDHATVIMAAAESTGIDQGIRHELEAAGVRVVSEFQPRIEQLYQLADCYVFPVRSDDGAIGLPLSVLEAMACDLPVVTTPFGALPSLFEDSPGLQFAEDDEAIVAAVADRSWMTCCSRTMVEGFTWEACALRLLEAALP